MSRRRLLIAASLFTSLLLAGALAWLCWPRESAITRENAAAIRNGMTMAEVEALLGGPPRDETTGPVEVDLSDGNAVLLFLMDLHRDWMRTHDLLQNRGDSIRTWRSDHAQVLVHFDAAQRVLDVAITPMRRTEEGVLATIRRWLHL